MVTAILPVYLVFQLRFTPMQFGLFNGIYFAVSGAHVGDRRDRRRPAPPVQGDRRGRLRRIRRVQLGLLAVLGNVPFPASGVLFTDRVGKGLRTSPRDVFISLSSEPVLVGRSFGVHRAFDTVGAALGPIVVFAVLRARRRVPT